MRAENPYQSCANLSGCSAHSLVRAGPKSLQRKHLRTCGPKPTDRCALMLGGSRKTVDITLRRKDMEIPPSLSFSEGSVD